MRLYEAEGRQDFNARGTLPGSGHPDLDGRTRRFKARIVSLCPWSVEGLFIGFNDV